MSLTEPWLDGPAEPLTDEDLGLIDYLDGDNHEDEE